MTNVPYEPRPGTLAFRVLAHMESLPDDMEVTTGAIAAAVRCDGNLIASSMQQALANGLIFARKKGGHERSPLFWSRMEHSDSKTSFKGAAMVPRSESGRAERACSVANPSVAPPSIPRPAVHSPVSARSEAAPAAQPHGDQGEGRATPNDGAPTEEPPTDRIEVAPRLKRAAQQRAAWPEPTALRIALWSDGTLQIQRNADDVLMLDADETAQLLHYLERLAETTT